VLLALGNDKSGYTFYVKQSFNLNIILDLLDIQLFLIKANGWKDDTAFQFDKTANNEGTGTLYVNDENVGNTQIEMLPFKVSFEGLDIRRFAVPVGRIQKPGIFLIQEAYRKSLFI
jgi:arylsulfatase